MKRKTEQTESEKFKLAMFELAIIVDKHREPLLEDLGAYYHKHRARFAAASTEDEFVESVLKSIVSQYAGNQLERTN